MLNRVVVWTALVLAGVCLAFAALLIRPADVFEMLVGFAAGSLGTVQWGLLGIALALLLLTATVHGPATRAQRLTRMAFGALLAIIVVSVGIRDNRDFSTTTVTIPAANIGLEGTLYRPRNESGVRHPAILIIHGSGPMKRDAYHLIARRFAERGFVVLNMDKRGVGGSTGTYPGDNLRDPVIQHRALDARLALDYLAAQPGIDTARIGVFAISQGGWVVPLLLTADSPSRFGIVFSGVTVSSVEEGRWSDWAGEDNDHFGFKPPPMPFPELDRRLRAVVPGDFDPRQALARMTAPSLWLFGEWDSSAPTAASMRVIDTLKRAKVPVSARVFPEANHGLFVVRGPRGKRNANYAPGVWETVFAWTDQQGITPRNQE